MPGNNSRPDLDGVGTSGASCVLATSVIRIRIGGEELRHGWIWRIGDGIVHGTLDVAKEVLNGVPMGYTRI
jgi:hypothetical protein